MNRSGKIKRMTRRTASVMIAAAMITTAFIPSVVSDGTSLSVNAASEAAKGSVLIDGDFSYSVNNNGTADIYKYIGKSSEAVIPEKLGGLDVAGLGSGAFKDCTSVTLPTSVNIDITPGTFAGCTMLKKIVIPDGTRDVIVEDNSFTDCISLEEITGGSGASGIAIRNGVLFNGNMTTLLCYPAAKAANIYYVPESVTGIAQGAFNNVRNTTGVSFLHCYSLKSINPEVFKGSDGIEVIELSKSIEFEDSAVYFDIPSLQAVNIAQENPDYYSEQGVIYSKNGEKLIYYPVGKVESSFEIPSSVKEIRTEGMTVNQKLKEITVAQGNNSFSAQNGVLFSEGDFRSLEVYPCAKNEQGYTVPEGVTQISSFAFKENRFINNVIISDSVTTICTDAFMNCTSLKGIMIGSGLEAMYVSPFRGCSALEIIDVSSQNEKYYCVDDVLYEHSDFVDESGKKLDVLVVYPSAKKGESFTVPSSVSRIGTEAFAGNPYIKSVSAASGSILSYIEYGAFSDCTALNRVSPGSAVKTIESNAFEGCKSLAQFTIPSSVEELGNELFKGCEKLTAVNSDSNYFVSENGTLFDADKSTLLYYPEGKQDKEYKVPDSVNYLTYYSFADNKYIEKLELSKSIDECDNEFISGCTSLRELIIPDMINTFEPEGINRSGILEIYSVENESVRIFALRNGIRYYFYSSDSVINNSYISKNVITGGQSITLNGRSSGNNDGCSYAFEYKKSDEESWITIGKKYDSSVSQIFSTEEAGTYDIRITAKNSSGKTAERYFSVLVKDALANKSELNKDTVFLGQSVTLTGKAEGGEGGYLYEYLYKYSTKTAWSKIKAYSSTTNVSFLPKVSGKYDLCVKAKDSNGTVSTKKFVLEVSNISVLKNTSNISAAEVRTGESVKLTAKCTGGKADYKYAFYFRRKNNTKWNVIGTEFGKASTASFRPTSAAIYDVRIDIKDASGQSASKSFTVSSSNGEFENISTISTDYITKAQTPVRLNGMAVGGSGKYSYAYYFKRASNTKWNSIGTVYGSQTSVTLTTTALTYYDVMISIRDEESGKVVSKTFQIKSSIPEALKNESNVAAESLKLGESVVIKGAASGGIASYKYTYQFKRKKNTSWKTLGSAKTTSTTASFKPLEADKYDVRVTVTDSAGNEVVKDFSVTTYDIVNTSTVDKTSAVIGTAFRITGSISGGTNNIRYSYYYRKAGTSSWTTVKEKTTSSTADITPVQSGSYELYVVITDGTGITADKTFNVTVYDELQNTSTINATVIKKGNSIILTGSATGGTGNYTYAFYYRKEGNQTFVPIGKEFDGRTKDGMTPSGISNYEFKVVVKDDSGATAEKIFNVTVKPSGRDELPIIPAY